MYGNKETLFMLVKFSADALINSPAKSDQCKQKILGFYFFHIIFR